MPATICLQLSSLTCVSNFRLYFSIFECSVGLERPRSLAALERFPSHILRASLIIKLAMLSMQESNIFSPERVVNSFLNHCRSCASPFSFVGSTACDFSFLTGVIISSGERGAPRLNISAF